VYPAKQTFVLLVVNAVASFVEASKEQNNTPVVLHSTLSLLQQLPDTLPGCRHALVFSPMPAQYSYKVRLEFISRRHTT